MTIDRNGSMAIAQELIATLAKPYPALKFVVSERGPSEIEWLIPAQPGIKQDIWLSFQNNDEFHFSVGHFWIEYFPCTEAAPREQFIDAVTGFIDGRYRILEHYRGKRCVAADLQKPGSEGWKTIASWGRFSWPIPLRKNFKTIANA